MRRVLVATRSDGKLRELRPLLAAAGITPLDLDMVGLAYTAAEEEIEMHDTFEANALAKARYFHALSGLPVMADDSGLEVDALGGRPGVRSKRWAGRSDLRGQALDDANNAALRAALEMFVDRRGGYICAAAFVDTEGEVVRRGETWGTLLREPQGNGGFGYDPYFWSAELTRTFGEASVEAKASVSHRARAFAALLAALVGRR